MLKKILCIWFVFSCFESVLAKNNFVPGIPDIPVPENFYFVKDTSTMFYDDSGRIIEASFKGRGELNEVIQFYIRTLPALGWVKNGDIIGSNSNDATKPNLSFIRDGESLQLMIKILDQDRMKEEIEINFSLKPL